MNAPTPADPQKPSKYVQAIPIYLASDTEVARYFKECRDEIGQISGAHLQILVSRIISDGNTGSIVKAVDAGSTSRFPGLKFGHLPCLWIEDEFKRHILVRLPQTFQDIKAVLQNLADVCRTTKDAPKIKQELAAALTVDIGERQPGFSAFIQYFDRLLERAGMTKTTEKLIALIFGVIFVTAILVIALFIGNPTPFQYTVFRIVLAIAAAGFVSMTPGFIEAKVGSAIRAGGALAVFLIVYFYAPAALQAIAG